MRLSCIFTSALLLFVSATTANALPSDRQQAIEILAASALRDEKKGLTVYQGNVVIKQGTILIKADKVTIHGAGSQISKIVCTGTPAHYQQQPKPDGGPVIARANTIEYQLSSDMIHLIDSASLEQDGSVLNGERIDYDIKQEIIKARGASGGDQRIRMVIPPSQQQETP